MDMSIRWGTIIAFATLALSMLGGWVQINTRIAVLEVQVKEYQKANVINQKKLDEMGSNIQDIKATLIEIKGDMKLKQDKKWEP